MRYNGAMLVLDNEEAIIVQTALNVAWPNMPQGQCLAAKKLLDKIGKTIITLGERVFSLELPLWSEVNKEANKVRQERKAMRETMGVKRLAKGQGPEVPHRAAAPTLNEWNGMETHLKTILRADIDELIAKEKSKWPRCNMGVTERGVTHKVKGETKIKVVREGGRRRVLRLTRYSSVRPDELSLDCAGAKCPTDRLVHAGILRDDNEEWLHRDKVEWIKVPRGEGRVVIDVYEIVQ